MRETFLKTIEANEDDDNARHIFADWLDEQGEYDEAERQRKWCGAKRRLSDLATECGGNMDDYGIDNEDGFTYGAYHAYTFTDMIRAGYHTIQNGYGMVQMGTETARSVMDNARVRAQFWSDWEIITGDKRPTKKDDDDWFDDAPFGCSC